MCDTEVGLASFSAKTDYADVDIVLPLGIFEATLSAEALVGAVGIGIELDPESGKFKITPPTCGMGWSFAVDST